MRTLAATAILFALTTTFANAQATQTAPRQTGSVQILSSIPNGSMTVTNWYKQSVYDPGDNKIGEIMDVLLDRGDGTVTALIIGVGGFLGAGEKDVAVPFKAVQPTTKGNNKWYLVVNSTKEALKDARGFKYDRDTMTWVPAEPETTTGSSPRPAPR